MAAPLRVGFCASHFISTLTSRHSFQFQLCRHTTAYFNGTLGFEQRRFGHGGTFFARVNPGELWKGVTGVSNAGRKKGRANIRRSRKTVDLNRGQKIGEGHKNMAFPGLNTKLAANGKMLPIERLKDNPNRMQQLVEIREMQGRVGKSSTPPLLRGYTSVGFGGKSIGPPSIEGEYNWKEFDSRVLHTGMVVCMTKVVGRRARFSTLVGVGNGKGLVGIANSKSARMMMALNAAKNRAAKRLQPVELYNGHTVYHNMHYNLHGTKLFITRKEKGYGLKCHRVLRSLCELIGIKDIHIKVEAGINPRKIAAAFLAALQNQETHQDLADRTGYYIVEQRKERNNFPVVVAAPTSGLIATEPLQDEEKDLEGDFDRLYAGGKVAEPRPPQVPFYIRKNLPGWQKHVRQNHLRRGQMDLKMLRKAGLV